MRTEHFLLTLPPLLLLLNGLVLWFTYRYEEPYPAITQPAFARATSTPERIVSTEATITVQTTTGRQSTLSFERLLPYMVANRGTRMFAIMRRNAAWPAENSYPPGWRRLIFDRYNLQMHAKATRSRPAFVDYLRRTVSEEVDEPVDRVTFYLHEVTTHPHGAGSERILLDSIIFTL